MEQLELFADDRDTKINKVFEAIEKIQTEMNQIIQEVEQEQEHFWESLTKEQQLKVFCAVVRRIYQGEIADKGSYRHVLYDVFGFGPESYVQAQAARYLEIHNSIIVSNEQHT